MNMLLFSSGIDLIVLIISYLFWNKSRDKQFLWFVYTGIIVTTVDFIRVILYPSLPLTFLLISRGVSIIFDLLIILLVLKILFIRKDRNS